MLVDLIKFIHILLTLSLLGSAFYCLVLVIAKKNASTLQFHFFNKLILTLLPFALLSGTLLIYPKKFTFHTPWIQAAYFLITLFASLVAFFIIKKNQIQRRWIWLFFYLFLNTILILIIHDAVTKTTFLFL